MTCDLSPYPDGLKCCCGAIVFKPCAAHGVISLQAGTGKGCGHRGGHGRRHQRRRTAAAAARAASDARHVRTEKWPGDMSIFSALLCELKCPDGHVVCQQV